MARKQLAVRFGGGLNNKYHPDNTPEGQVFIAVDCQFNNGGDVLLPCQGASVVYPSRFYGCSSLRVDVTGMFFIENDDLKYSDNYDSADGFTSNPLIPSVGSSPMSYTRPIGDTVYFSNGTITGKHRKGAVVTSEWGVTVPGSPTCTIVTAIDPSQALHAGDYMVAVSWIAGSESGFGNSVYLTLPEGCAIDVTPPANPPSYVTHFAVWITEVNSKDLCLFGEYAINTPHVHLIRKKCTLVQDTQFGFPPQPEREAVLMHHHGRIYFSDGNILRYTHIGKTGSRYDICFPYAYHVFDESPIKIAVSVPGMLYVGTAKGLYKVPNIDDPEFPAVPVPLQDCAAIKGSEHYDSDGITAYFMTNRGMIAATPEGLREITYKDVAMPLDYTYGSMTTTGVMGIEALIFYGFNGKPNPEANDDWNYQNWGTSKLENSGWCANLKTGAVAKYESLICFNMSNGYFCNEDGIYRIDESQNKTIGRVETGLLDFKISNIKRLPDLYLQAQGGDVELICNTDNSAVTYTFPASSLQIYRFLRGARGQLGQNWILKLSNTDEPVIVGSLVVEPIVVPRH